MTRARAWAISIIATVSLLALVLGVGASTGQFGFQQGGTTAQARAVTPGDGVVSQQVSGAGSDGDDHEGYEEDEDHENDEEGEHESDDHEEHEGDGHEDDEHEDDD